MATARTYDPNNRAEVIKTLRQEIQAAQLKVVLDRELGRKTSEAVKKLATMDLPSEDPIGLSSLNSEEQTE